MTRSAFRALHAGAFTLCLVFASQVFAEPSEPSVSFARQFALTNGTLLRSSQIAQNDSTDPQVRQLASRLASESQRADKAFAEACRKAGIRLPARSEATSTIPESSGNTLDRVYTLEVSQQLAKARALLAGASQSNDIDASLREFAQQRLKEVEAVSATADALARSQAGVNR